MLHWNVLSETKISIKTQAQVFEQSTTHRVELFIWEGVRDSGQNDGILSIF